MNKLIITTIMTGALGAAAFGLAGTASADIERVQPGYTGSGTVFVPQTSKQAMTVVGAAQGAPLLTGGATLTETKHSIVEMTIRDSNVVPSGKQYAPAIQSYEAIASGIDRIYGKSPESIGVGVQIGRGYIDDPLAPAE